MQGAGNEKEKDDNLKGGNLIELPSLPTPTKPIGIEGVTYIIFKCKRGFTETLLHLWD